MIMCFLENTYYYELYGKDGVSVELVSKWTGVPINQIKSFKF